MPHISEIRGQPHLSASSVNDYLDCGLLYKFSRIDKIQPEFRSDADMAHDCQYFNASSIPIFGLGLLPAIWRDDVTALLGLREVIPVWQQALQEKGYKNVLLARMLGGSIGTFLNTKNVLVKVPADIKGMRLRSTGPSISAAFKRMGAAPLIVPTAEVYENLARNLIEGAVSYLGSTVDYKLHEVTKYGTMLSFGHSIQGLILNKQSLNKLSQPDQELVKEFAAWAGNEMGLKSSVAKQRDIAFNKRELKELYTPTEKEMELWNQAFAPTIDEWVKQAGPLGKKIMEILQRWNALYPVK